MTITLADIAESEKICEAATEGPWIRGYMGGRCSLDHEHGKGNCQYVQSGLYDNPHRITGGTIQKGEAHDLAIQVAGCYDYDEGGIIHERDTTFITHARTRLPAMNKLAREMYEILKEVADDVFVESCDFGTIQKARRLVERLEA